MPAAFILKIYKRDTAWKTLFVNCRKTGKLREETQAAEQRARKGLCQKHGASFGNDTNCSQIRGAGRDLYGIAIKMDSCKKRGQRLDKTVKIRYNKKKSTFSVWYYAKCSQSVAFCTHGVLTYQNNME